MADAWSADVREMVSHNRHKEEVADWERSQQFHVRFLEAERHPQGQSRQESGDSGLH